MIGKIIKAILISGLIVFSVLIVFLVIFGLVTTSADSYHKDLVAGEKVDLSSLSTIRLRKIFAIDTRNIESNRLSRKYQNDEYNEYLAFEGILKSGKSNLSFSSLNKCAPAELEEYKVVGIKCDILDPEIPLHSNILNQCFVSFGGIDPDTNLDLWEEIEYLHGDIICDDENNFTRLLKKFCYVVGDNFECSKNHYDVPLSVENRNLRPVMSSIDHGNIARILSTRKNNTWKGYKCKVDCSGHRAGYKWAKKNSIEAKEDCINKSISFQEGCLEFIK